MSRSPLTLCAELGETVHVCGSIDEAIALDPPAIFKRAEMLVIDDLEWRADFGVIRTGLEPVQRTFKGPWHFDIPPDVAWQVNYLQHEAEDLFAVLYPDYKVVDREKSFRALITGPDPMHFDTKITKHPVVSAYINVAETPRRYEVGPTFQQVCDRFPDLMMEIWSEDKKNGKLDASYGLRKLSRKGQLPLSGGTPRHQVAMAPGSIWFMDAKTLAHTAIYGEGAVMVAWEVEGSDAPQQPKILRKMMAARERRN